MDTLTVIAGLVAYSVSLLVSITLIFLTYRLNTIITSKIDEEKYLLSGHRSIAIALGSTILSQAILLRHVVFPTMTIVRDLFRRHCYMVVCQDDAKHPRTGRNSKR
jgi:hypothetical protein